MQSIKTGAGVYAGKNPPANAKWNYAVAPSNFYRITNVVPAESADFVEVEAGLFGSTKFDPVLLKEWFSVLKVGGELVVPASVGAAERLAGLMAGFFPENAWGPLRTINENGISFAVARKLRPALAPGDDISKWTFGIITNGKRNEAVEKILKSIRALRIPEYEVIVCGKYYDRKEPDVRYIEFTELDNKGWITKKKNLICEASRFENMVILHDRLVFAPDWYEGMRRFGNHFDAMSCVQITDNGLRAFDWYTQPPDLQVRTKRFRFWAPLLGGPLFEDVVYSEMGLHYDDWDPYVVMNGGLTILKRSVWEKAPWDESRFWNEAEDVDISHRISKIGGVVRFNPHSRCVTMFWRHCVTDLAERRKDGLGRRFERPSFAQALYNARYYFVQDYRRARVKITGRIKKNKTVMGLLRRSGLVKE